MRIGLAVSAWFGFLAIPSIGAAQDYEDPCANSDSKSRIEAAAYYSANEYAGVDASIYSAVGVYRRCQTGSLDWHVSLGADRAEIAGRNVSAVRLGGGGAFRFSEAEAFGGIGRPFIALSASIGYEDYYYFSSAMGQFRKDYRTGTSAEVMGGYFVSYPFTESSPPTFISDWSVDVRAGVYDKRAPSTDAPTYADETFGTVGVGATVTQFVDHGLFGSKIDYGLSYQTYFGDNVLLSEIGSFRVQWRPQTDAVLSRSPDLMALGVTVRTGSDGFRGFSLSLSRVF